MRQEMSVSELLTEVEARVKHHESREAHHAEQEIFHREQKELHAAELQTARERLAAYRAAAEAARELVARTQLSPKPLDDDLPPGASVLVSRLAARVVATRTPSETFSATAIAREINKRYGKRLRRPATTRTVATALRRMAAAGRIHQIEKGRGPRQGVYSRGGKGE